MDADLYEGSLMAKGSEGELTNEDRTNPMGLFHYARSYWQSALSLTVNKPNVTHPSAPITFLFYHAIELYIKAYLRFRGFSVSELRQYSHSAKKAANAAESEGLTFTSEDKDVFGLMDDYDNVIRSRYITTGMFTKPGEEVLAGVCERLDYAVGDALRLEGIPVRPFERTVQARTDTMPDLDSEIEEELEALSKVEREILCYLLDKNERLFTCAIDGGHAVTLFSRNIVRWAVASGQQVHPEDVPVEIPKPVWKILQKNKNRFPCSGELRNGPHPWRVHWMAR